MRNISENQNEKIYACYQRNPEDGFYDVRQGKKTLHTGLKLGTAAEKVREINKANADAVTTSYYPGKYAA